jgi:hypothetical protein
MLINIRRASVTIVSVCNLYVIFIKNYIEIFHGGTGLSFIGSQSLSVSDMYFSYHLFSFFVLSYLFIIFYFIYILNFYLFLIFINIYMEP